MEKLYSKGVVRNRYAKIHPVVDRINVLKNLDIIASNISHRCNESHDKFDRSDEFNVGYYTRQLQSDIGNLTMNSNEGKKNKDTRLTENKMYKALPYPEYPSPVSLDQPNSFIAINSEAIRKRKKQKHRNNREKQTRSLSVGLKIEQLFNIMKLIFYVILCWPVIFFAKLIFMIVNLPIFIFCICISKLNSLFSSENISSNVNMALKPLENESDISRALKKEETNLENNKQTLNLTNFGSDKMEDSFSGNRFVSQESPMRLIDEEKSLKKLINYSSQKNFNSSYERNDETINDIDDSQLKRGENYSPHRHRRHSRQKNTRNLVGLNSDCVSEKYSDKFYDMKNCSKRKSTIRQNQSSFSALKNSSFKDSKTIIDEKRLNDSKNCFSEKINDVKNLSKKISIDLSDSVSVELLEENKFRHVDSRILNYNNIYCSDKFIDNSLKNSATLLFVNSRKKRCEKSKVHTVSCPPFKHCDVLGNKSLINEEDKAKKIEERAENFYNNYNPLINPSGILDESKPVFQNCKSRGNEGMRKLQETFSKVVKCDSLKKNDATNFASHSLNDNKIEKPLPESDKSKFVYHKFDSGELKCESILKNEFKVDISSEMKDKVCTKKTTGFSTKFLTDDEEKEKRILESVETGNQESNKEAMIFEEVATKPSSNLKLKSRESSKSVAEFTKPIDAKSKWLEMKRKFYGKDYKGVNIDIPESDKPQSQNLRQIKSISKLPAQKIFQYNMLVGRARQMGAEPLSSSEENPRSSSALRQFLLMQNGSDRNAEELYHNQTIICKESGSNASKNASQNTVKNFRRLSQTQSLSQWPLDPMNGSYSRSKKCLGEQKPKPKPRNDKGGSFNYGNKVAGAGKEHCCKIPQAMTTTRINSSMSSSDVRNRNIVTNIGIFGQRAEEKLLQLSDGEMEDRRTNETTIKNQGRNIAEDLLEIM